MKKPLDTSIQQYVRGGGDTILFDFDTGEFCCIDAAGCLRTYHVPKPKIIASHGGTFGWWEHQKKRKFKKKTRP